MKSKILTLTFSFLAFFTFSATTQASFTDVTEDHPYFFAINYFEQEGIVNGYQDGSYQPEKQITRAEFSKILLKTKFPEKNFEEFKDSCFTDINQEDWHSGFICYLKNENILKGYEDGSMKADLLITLPEASKLITMILEIPTVELNKEEYPEWYQESLQTLLLKRAIPTSVNFLHQNLNRGEIAEIVWRLNRYINDRPFTSKETLQTELCENIDQNLPANVDMKKVREEWVKWYNAERSLYGLAPYSLNQHLSKSAEIWSDISKERGYIDHRRFSNSAYYDYNQITNWYKNLGLSFTNVGGSTHTENINWGYYTCPDSAEDCTDAMLTAAKTGFNFFMREKAVRGVHYRSIVQPNFREIGLGIAIDRNTNKYYLTTHIGTEVITENQTVCN